MRFESFSEQTTAEVKKSSELSGFNIPEKLGETTKGYDLNIPQELGEKYRKSDINIPNELGGNYRVADVNIPKELGLNDYSRKIPQKLNEGINQVKHAANKVFIEHDDPRRYSTPQERLNYTPKNTGEWTEDRGNSKFIPYSDEAKEALSNYGLDGIEYKNGIPDFSGCAEATGKIDMMNPLSRYGNFNQYDISCAELWSKNGHDGKYDWTARDVKNWRESNKYTWHECNDRKTAQLVPGEIHSACRHLGGISEMKNYYKVIVGGFDE